MCGKSLLPKLSQVQNTAFAQMLMLLIMCSVTNDPFVYNRIQLLLMHDNELTNNCPPLSSFSNFLLNSFVSMAQSNNINWTCEVILNLFSKVVSRDGKDAREINRSHNTSKAFIDNWFTAIENFTLILYQLEYSYITFRILKFLNIVVRSVSGHFFSTALDLTPYKNTWTVVTGCTDGIGRAYVLELAKKRGIMKFYLIGRNQSKLDGISQELTDKYSCVVKTAQFDFENDSYDKLPAELAEIPVGILINCVGIAPERVANFAELPAGLPSKILRVNLMSAVKMIELVLPGMLKRDLGIVVSVASITGWRPLPYLSTYPASKAALSFFSDSLADEFGSTNVKFQCLIPFLVATKMASYEKKRPITSW
uniref:Uncharacterized protein n=1 Tax=Ditylenchus dipsaci TaxID=166011 RepID=A0A915DNT9_9BILA